MDNCYTKHTTVRAIMDTNSSGRDLNLAKIHNNP